MKSKLLPLVVAAFVFPTVGFGLGIRVVDQDAEATARGEAFTATADNPSAIYYNPAGITQLKGQHLQIGMYSIYLQDKYNSPAGDAFRTKDKVQGVPQIYYTYSFEKYPISVGLGVYAPYGFGLSYPDNTPFRQAALKGGIQYLTINPVIAWRINDQLSIAAGATLNYADANLERGILASQNNSFKFEGHGVDVGFNLGLLWQPYKEHSFGIKYHSATEIGLNGNSIVSIPIGGIRSVEKSTTDFKFPQFISAGYSYRPTPAWNFEVDLDWADWHQLKTLTLMQQNSGSIALPFNWQSSFMYQAGVTRYFENGYQLSGGYIYSESSVPKGNFNPIVPDSDRHILSAGFGRKTEKYSWEVAYQFAYGPPMTIANGGIADGSYRFISHAISLSFGYHF